MLQRPKGRKVGAARSAISDMGFLAGFSPAHVLSFVDSRWYTTVHVIICAQMVIMPTDKKCLERAKHTLFLLEKVEDIIVRKLKGQQTHVGKVIRKSSVKDWRWFGP